MDKLQASSLILNSYGARKRPFTRTVTFSAPASTLTDFPALVKLPAGSHVATGYDVAFETLGGVPLPFELDFYDAMTGAGAWWVKIPTLAAGSPTTIRMTYGSRTITTDQSAAAAVWSGYFAVLHLTEPSTTHVKDSVTGAYLPWVNSQYLTQVTFSSEHSVTGRSAVLTFTNVPASNTFENATYILFPTTASYSLYQAVVWGGCSSFPSRDYLLARGMCVGKSLYKWPNPILESPATGDPLRRYRCLSGADGAFCGRIDDASVASGHPVTMGYPVSALCLFSDQSPWSGALYADEVRLRLTSVSADWLEYEYKNSANHDQNTTYGFETKA